MVSHSGEGSRFGQHLSSLRKFLGRPARALSARKWRGSCGCRHVANARMESTVILQPRLPLQPNLWQTFGRYYWSDAHQKHLRGALQSRYVMGALGRFACRWPVLTRQPTSCLIFLLSISVRVSIGTCVMRADAQPATRVFRCFNRPCCLRAPAASQCQDMHLISD
jgi:hypothetical protein